MSSNIEIKAYYPNLEKAHTIAIGLGAKPSLSQYQRDTYFRVASGRLKLREIPDAAWLIPYIRPNDLSAKRSDYEVIDIANPSHTREMLAQMLGISVVVEKHREIYLLENVRIHLDNVTDLGCFIEFEAVFDPGDPSAEKVNRIKVQQLMEDFEIDASLLISDSYHDLLLRKLKAHSVGA
ncbi:MAG TPA: class IV adenylate cyclase [Blastocatellia bacterium]|nr:class IV adenylate cyclase [Blastocatellia bacterium]